MVNLVLHCLNLRTLLLAELVDLLLGDICAWAEEVAAAEVSC